MKQSHIRTLVGVVGAVCIMLSIASSIRAGSEDELIIPSSAHEKAVEAMKALGLDRGANAIDFRSVDILGVSSREIQFDAKQLKKALLDLGARETPTEIQIELASDVLFDFDKSDIRPEAIDALAKVAGVIKGFKNPRVVVSGHTDSKGSDDYNLKLSKRRADSVKTWLSAKGEVDESIINTVGYGEAKPKTPNTKPDGSDNPAGRQKNRRVEILVKKK